MHKQILQMQLHWLMEKMFLLTSSFFSGDVHIEEQLRRKIATNTLNEHLLKNYLEKIGIRPVREKRKI